MMVIDLKFEQSWVDDFQKKWTKDRYRFVEKIKFGDDKKDAVYFAVNFEQHHYFLVVVFSPLEDVLDDVIEFRDNYGVDVVGCASFQDYQQNDQNKNDDANASVTFYCSVLEESSLHT